jgi:hypothetical protein
MALGSTQPLTEISTRNLPGCKGQLAHNGDNLTTICELIVSKKWEPQRLTTLRAYMACYRDSFTFMLIILSSIHLKSVGSISLPQLKGSGILNLAPMKMDTLAMQRSLQVIAERKAQMANKRAMLSQMSGSEDEVVGEL